MRCLNQGLTIATQYGTQIIGHYEKNVEWICPLGGTPRPLWMWPAIRVE
jgi:hypothetical protein